MKFDSPLFDSVRVKPGKDRRVKTGGPACQWSGCKEKASHRAPKGRENEKDYWRFCLEHVRQYNQSYNFFKGMNDAAVMAYQKDAITGPVSYTHLRAHETDSYLVCRLLLEK